MPHHSTTAGVVPSNMSARTKDILLAMVRQLLPTTGDDLTAALLEQLAAAFLDREEELGATRLLLSETLTLTRAQHLEITRLNRRLAELLDARRGGRSAA